MSVSLLSTLSIRCFFFLLAGGLRNLLAVAWRHEKNLQLYSTIMQCNACVIVGGDTVTSCHVVIRSFLVTNFDHTEGKYSVRSTLEPAETRKVLVKHLYYSTIGNAARVSNNVTESNLRTPVILVSCRCMNAKLRQKQRQTWQPQ